MTIQASLLSRKINMDTKNGHISLSKPSFWVSILVFVGLLSRNTDKNTSKILRPSPPTSHHDNQPEAPVVVAATAGLDGCEFPMGFCPRVFEEMMFDVEMMRMVSNLKDL